MHRIKNIRKKNNSRVRVKSREGKVQLSIISIHMIQDTRFTQQVGQKSSIESEKKRTTNRTLGNTRKERRGGRRVRTNKNRLRPIREIRAKKRKSRRSYTKVKRETRKKNVVVNSVKGSREIKKN